MDAKTKSLNTKTEPMDNKTVTMFGSFKNICYQLRKLALDPSTGITSRGDRSQKVYILRP